MGTQSGSARTAGSAELDAIDRLRGNQLYCDMAEPGGQLVSRYDQQRPHVYDHGEPVPQQSCRHNLHGSERHYKHLYVPTGRFRDRDFYRAAILQRIEWFARANTCGTPCVPPMLNSTLTTITGWVKSAVPTLPVSYPAGSIVLTPGQRNWMGAGSLSDYASQYWDTGQQRPTYIFGKGIRESSYWMLSSFYARQPYMQLNRPQLMLIGLSDTAYVKNSPSGTDGFNPPVDQFVNPGAVSRSVGSSMFSAICAGVAGLRLYQFEGPDDYAAEVNGGPGGSYQTGAAPFYGSVNLWRSMGYSAALMTKVLQPYVLSPPATSPALGRNIITGVRKAATGTMLVVVNSWDGGHALNIDFTPYKFGFGAIRYRVSDTAIKTAILPDENGETISLTSGEVAVYIFPNSNAPTGLDNVTFQPISPVGSSKMIVTYGYLYQQNVAAYGDPHDCTSGCVLPVDRRIGDVFFQYTFLDPAQNVIRSGSMMELGPDNSVLVQPPRGSKLQQPTLQDRRLNRPRPVCRGLRRTV